jgi:hypothetical protein
MLGTKPRRKLYGKCKNISISRFVLLLIHRINTIGVPAISVAVMSAFNIPVGTRETDCVIAGVDMQVTFTYDAPSGVDAIYGQGGVYEIYAVKLNGVDLILVLNEETLQTIEDQLEDGRNCAIDY